MGLRGVSLWGFAASGASRGQPGASRGQPLGASRGQGASRGRGGFAGSAFVFCFRSCRYPPDGNERAIKVMLQDQQGTHARS